MTAFVLMGVAGSGKSTVGRRVAAVLGLAFVEGDDHHPPENVAKMRAGRGLTDGDRVAWIERLAAAILDLEADAVVACSALTPPVRARLAARLGHRPMFLHLVGPARVIAERLEAREGHFMQRDMLPGQLAALEPPDDAVSLDVTRPIDDVVAAAAAVIRARQART